MISPKSASVNDSTNIMSGQHSLNYTKHRPALKLHQLVQKIIIRNQFKTHIQLSLTKKIVDRPMSAAAANTQRVISPQKLLEQRNKQSPMWRIGPNSISFPFSPLLQAKSYFHFKVAQ